MKKIFFILIIFMLSLSFVSASDLNDTDIISDSNNSYDDLQNANSNYQIADVDESSSKLAIQENENDNLTDDGGEFVDTSEAYVLLNEFRNEKGVWYWMKDDITKTYFNTNDNNQLYPLIRDVDLEETAKIRAKEASEYFEHIRPDGSDITTAFPDTITYPIGECLAYAQNCEEAIDALKETYYQYEYQGHRRNMLDIYVNHVGIGGYKTKDGDIYWAVETGVNVNDPTYDVHPFISSINLDAPYKVVKGYKDSKKKFEITLTNNNTPISKAEIEINLNGVNYTRITNNDGKVFLDINFDTGDYKAIVTYGEIAATSNIKIKPITLLAPDVTGIYGNTEVIAFLTNKSLPLPGEPINLYLPNGWIQVPTDDEGISRFNLNNLDAGIYNLTAYLVDGEYEMFKVTIATTKVTINKCPTSIDSFNWQRLSHNSVKLEASISPISEGKMNFTVNEKNYTVDIKDSKASLILSDLAPGNYSFSAAFDGNKNYESSVSSINESFISEEYRIDLNVTDITKDYGGDEQLAIRLSDNDFNSFANSKVTMTINGVSHTRTTNENGEAFMPINLNAGTYEAVVSYNNITTTAKVTVNPLNTKTTLTSAKNSHNSYTLTAEVSPSSATGNVTFTVNGRDYVAKIIDSKSTYTLNNLDVGPYSIKATYSGDTNHKKSESNNISFTIDEIKIDINAPDLTKYFKGSERFVVTLKEDNKPLENKNITITLNGITFKRTTNSNGQTSIAINLNSGVYNATTEYDGIKVQSTITVRSTVSGNDVTKIYKNATQYYATFVDTSGNLLKNTGVEFNINGVLYKRTTNDQGTAKMNINLNPGTYVITATNPSSTEQYTNIIKVLPSIVENNDLTKYYRNESKYTLKILGDDGKPVGEGVAVKLNINGVFYERKTNASGYMNMNINLNPGTYIITAEYNGLMASNTVKVLPILSAKDVNMKYRDGSKFEVKLLDGKGNAFSNQTIIFNINGVFYNRITDENGIARLNINLQAGEYIITSTYSNGAALANKVTISS